MRKRVVLMFGCFASVCDSVRVQLLSGRLQIAKEVALVLSPIAKLAGLFCGSFLGTVSRPQFEGRTGAHPLSVVTRLGLEVGPDSGPLLGPPSLQLSGAVCCSGCQLTLSVLARRRHKKQAQTRQC